MRPAAPLLIVVLGGLQFGIVQARSRENKSYIIFVHPAEFLVTGPDGTILERTILGDRLLVSHDEVGGERDPHRVFYFELP